MFEKGILIAVALVGGYASITGTLPAVIIALFGNPSVLASSSTGDLEKAASAVGGGVGGALLDILGPLGEYIGSQIGSAIGGSTAQK